MRRIGGSVLAGLVCLAACNEGPIDDEPATFVCEAAGWQRTDIVDLDGYETSDLVTVGDDERSVVAIFRDELQNLVEVHLFHVNDAGQLQMVERLPLSSDGIVLGVDRVEAGFLVARIDAAGLFFELVHADSGSLTSARIPESGPIDGLPEVVGSPPAISFGARGRWAAVAVVRSNSDIAGLTLQAWRLEDRTLVPSRTVVVEGAFDRSLLTVGHGRALLAPWREPALFVVPLEGDEAPTRLETVGFVNEPLLLDTGWLLPETSDYWAMSMGVQGALERLDLPSLTLTFLTQARVVSSSDGRDGAMAAVIIDEHLVVANGESGLHELPIGDLQTADFAGYSDAQVLPVDQLGVDSAALSRLTLVGEHLLIPVWSRNHYVLTIWRRCP